MSYLPRGLDLLISPGYSLIFPDFLKILHENKIILTQRGFEQTTLTTSGSATVYFKGKLSMVMKLFKMFILRRYFVWYAVCNEVLQLPICAA